MGYYQDKLKELDSIDNEDELLKFLENLKRQEGSGDFHLILAFTNDALGNQPVAEWNYKKAKECGFDTNKLELWYESFGSTLRWGYKLKESKSVLEEGVSFFPEGKKLKSHLALTRYRLKEIPVDHLRDIILENTPELAQFIQEEMGIPLGVEEL